MAVVVPPPPEKVWGQGLFCTFDGSAVVLAKTVGTFLLINVYVGEFAESMCWAKDGATLRT